MNKITTKTVNTITTLEIADMLEMKHYKILEKLEGTKDGKTRSLIKILQELNLDINSYFIFQVIKTKVGIVISFIFVP